LLDLGRPARSGTDVLAELRADPATRDVAVVVVTGHPECLSEALLEEADGVVGKPFDLDELIAVVRRAIQRASTRRAEVAPVVAAQHRQTPVRPRRASGVRGSRPRR
jgi:CheY-like chemotaxis protein